MATRKLQSPVSTVTRPQSGQDRKPLPAPVDMNDLGWIFNSPSPVLLPDASTWNKPAATPAATPPVQQSAPTSDVPSNPFVTGAYVPFAQDNYKKAMEGYNANKKPFQTYDAVGEPEWTFNEPPPEMRRDNVDRVNPAATDIALAMMGLGGLMGNSDYAIGAGTNFLTKANTGAHQADQADFQSRAGLYDDQLKAAGVRYQRDSDRINQRMRSIDAQNNTIQHENDSMLDNITRQYQIDSLTDRANEDRASREKLSAISAMRDFINSGRLKDADPNTLNKVRQFLLDGQGDQMMQYFWSGISPTEQARLNHAAASDAQRLQIAKERNKTTLDAIKLKTKSAEDIASMSSMFSLMRQGEISQTAKDVATITANARKAGAGNAQMEMAMRMAQAGVNQAHQDISRAEQAVAKAAQQMNSLRTRKDFIDTTGTAEDGLTPAGRVALEQADAEYQRATGLLGTAQANYQQKMQALTSAYNFYQQRSIASGDGGLPTLVGQDQGAPPPFDPQRPGNKQPGEANPGLPSYKMPPAPNAGAAVKPSAANGWKGLTGQDYRKMTPAQRKSVPPEMVMKFMTGG